MKKDTRFIALFSACGAAAMLGLLTVFSGSRAWFEGEDYGQVERFDVGLGEDSPISIGIKSQDGSLFYKDGLNDDDFRRFDPEFDENLSLQAVSSMFSSLWLAGSEEIKTPLLRKGYGYGSSADLTEVAQKGFLQFELFFLCPEDCHLYLSPESKAISDSPSGVLDCARLSLYSKDAFHIARLSEKKKPKTRLGGPLSLLNSPYYDHLDGKEIAYGERDGDVVYASAAPRDEVETDESLFPSIHKAGIERVNVLATPFVYEQSKTLAELCFDGSSEGNVDCCLGRITSNEPFRLVASVYLEGWDLDCVDENMHGSFSLDLRFIGHFDV